jgi:hypothetical protein
MTTSGVRRMPNQSAFLARKTTDSSNVTGNFVAYTVPFDTKIFDQHNDYNTSGVFTAPIDGRYFFVAVVAMSGITSTFNTGVLQFQTSKRFFFCNNYQIFNVANSSGGLIEDITVVTDMTAGDTMTVQAQMGQVGTTQTINVLGTSDCETFFGGFLAC